MHPGYRNSSRTRRNMHPGYKNNLKTHRNIHPGYKNSFKTRGNMHLYQHLGMQEVIKVSSCQSATCHLSPAKRSKNKFKNKFGICVLCRRRSL